MQSCTAAYVDQGCRPLMSIKGLQSDIYFVLKLILNHQLRSTFLTGKVNLGKNHSVD